jgi:hypothetical protein
MKANIPCGQRFSKDFLLPNFVLQVHEVLLIQHPKQLHWNRYVMILWLEGCQLVDEMRRLQLAGTIGSWWKKCSDGRWCKKWQSLANLTNLLVLQQEVLLMAE